jgi:hypothetical protein
MLRVSARQGDLDRSCCRGFSKCTRSLHSRDAATSQAEREHTAPDARQSKIDVLWHESEYRSCLTGANEQPSPAWQQ